MLTGERHEKSAIASFKFNIPKIFKGIYENIRKLRQAAPRPISELFTPQMQDLVITVITGR
jgi:hypothetical protein